MKIPPHAFLRSKGFTLVEVVLAMGIMSFGIVAVFALLPTGLASVREGRMEETASDILGMVATDLRAASHAGGASPMFEISAFSSNAVKSTAYLNEGAVTVPTEQARFRLIAEPRSSTNQEVTIWHLAVEWPAQAATPENRVETLVFLRP